MFHFALDGLWLAGAIVAAILVGIFLSQYVKDLIKGVPSALRTALSATESQALAALKDAEAAVVTEFTKKVAPAAAAAKTTSTATAAAAGAAAASPAPVTPAVHPAA